jgi:hypothetical protein
MLGEKLRTHRLIWLVILGFVLVLLIAAVAVTFFLVNITSAPSASKNLSVINQNPQPKTISSNVLFLGNTFWGRYINDWSMSSKLKYAYPFSQLSEFNRDQYNAWISGLECPLVAGLNISSAEMDQTLTFNCSPNYLPEAAKWFTAFTLANNHTNDQGASGFKQTQQNLDKYGIQYFGNPDPTVTADVC